MLIKIRAGRCHSLDLILPQINDETHWFEAGFFQLMNSSLTRVDTSIIIAYGVYDLCRCN